MAEQQPGPTVLRGDRRTRRRGAGSAAETHERPSLAPPPPAHDVTAPRRRPRSLPSPTADAGLTFAQETSALADRGATTVYPYILRDSVSPAELALAAARRELSRQQAWTPGSGGGGGGAVGVAADSDVAASHSSLARQSLSEDEVRRRLRAALASAESPAPAQPSLSSPGPDAAAGPTAPSQRHWTDGGSTVGVYAAGRREAGPEVVAEDDAAATAAAEAEAAALAGASTMAAVASPRAFDVTTAAVSVHTTDGRAVDGRATELYRGANNNNGTSISATVTHQEPWLPVEHQHQHQEQHQVQEPVQEGGMQFVVVDPNAKRELSQTEKDVSGRRA